MYTHRYMYMYLSVSLTTFVKPQAGESQCRNAGESFTQSVLVGSFKLLVSFAKEPYKRDYIMPKRPVIFRSLLIVATP